MQKQKVKHISYKIKKSHKSRTYRKYRKTRRRNYQRGG